MHLAPLAATLDAVLEGLPFSIAQELDAGAVHEQVERPIRTAIGIWTAKVFCLRHVVE